MKGWNRRETAVLSGVLCKVLLVVGTIHLGLEATVGKDRDKNQ